MLLWIAVIAALIVGASAADTIVTENGIRYNLSTGTVLGPVSKDSVVSITIRSSVNGSPITSIAPDAFNGCGKLTAVTMESGIATVGDSAFNSCTLLQSILLPDSISKIGDYAFANCGRLNNVILPTILTDIQTGTFANCSALKSIYIATVKTIHPDAFSGSGVAFLHRDTTGGLNQADTPELPVHVTTRVPGQQTDPTCVLQGKRAFSYNCKDGCGSKFNFSQDRPIAALGHVQGPLIPAVPETCSKDGTTEGHRCTRCNGIADGLERIPMDPTDPTKHNATLTKIPGKKPTCTESGLSDGEQCPDCGTMVTPQTEIPMSAHPYEDKDVIIREATCTEEGFQGTFPVCPVCGAVEECADCEKLKDDPEQKEAYEQHITTSHGGKAIAPKDHTPGSAGYTTTKDPTCTEKGLEEWKVLCSVCKEECGEADDVLDHPKRDIPALGHDISGGLETITKAPTCTEPGEKTVSAQACKRTGCDYKEGEQTGIRVDPLGHQLTEPVDRENVKEATCKEMGEDWLNFRECTREGCDYEEKDIVQKRGAHRWSNPEPDESKKDQDEPATCGKEGKSHVIVQCSVCDLKEAQVIALPATGKHDYEGSEWKTVKQPTATEPGLEQRPCKNCDHMDERVLPATGDPSKPEDPDEPEKPKSYQITVVQGAGGTASASRTTAQAGDRVTITFSPSSGYELDMIRIITADGKVLEPDSQNRFTMPAASVEIRVTFQRQNTGAAAGTTAPGSGSNSNARRTTDVMPSQNATLAAPQTAASEQRFRDIPMGHWAAGEIEWANQMGYMNGTGGLFNPNWNITHQQMWMILARLTGSNPASMAEARHWAVQGGYADGSAPTAPVKRHQLVTALYRCARLSNRLNQNTTSLAGYNDSRTVPAVARDAFSWALANGIVSGSADKNLMPNGNITRAQFAVILYRYSQRT